MSLDLWQFRFSEHEPQPDQLTADEIARANRYILPEKTRQFIIGRGLLRHVLNHYTQSVDIHYAEHGKPYLANQAVQFNVSHSNDLLVIGVSYTKSIGVDVEYVRHNIDMQGIADMVFSSVEMQDWHSHARSVQRFYELWTRKEAFLKTLGLGIGATSIPDSRWEITTFYPENGYIAAIALGD